MHLVFKNSLPLCVHLVFKNSLPLCVHLVFKNSLPLCVHLVFKNSLPLCVHLVFKNSLPLIRLANFQKDVAAESGLSTNVFPEVFHYIYPPSSLFKNMPRNSRPLSFIFEVTKPLSTELLKFCRDLISTKLETRKWKKALVLRQKRSSLLYLLRPILDFERSRNQRQGPEFFL